MSKTILLIFTHWAVFMLGVMLTALCVAGKDKKEA